MKKKKELPPARIYFAEPTSPDADRQTLINLVALLVECHYNDRQAKIAELKKDLDKLGKEMDEFEKKWKT